MRRVAGCGVLAVAAALAVGCGGSPITSVQNHTADGGDFSSTYTPGTTSVALVGAEPPDPATGCARSAGLVPMESR